MHLRRLVMSLLALVVAVLFFGLVLTRAPITARAEPVATRQEQPGTTAGSLVLTKTVGLNPHACAPTDAITVAAGSDVTYCFEVTNTGPTALARHDLVDSELGVVLTNFPYSLAPGASAFLTETATLTQTTTNTATWTAYNVGPVDVTVAVDTATVTVVPPIILTKTVGLDPSTCATTDAITVTESSDVTYCFEVTNTGPTTLALHDLDDSELGAMLAGLPYSLAPGASAFLTQTATLTQTTTNTAIWTAYNDGRVDVAVAVDTATVTVVPPSISLAKTVGLDPAVCAPTDAITVSAATDVTYCFEVTNTGPITLARHSLVDSDLGAVLAAFPYSLAPGASAFLTQTATLTQTTTNTATWTAYNDGPADVAIAVDTATVTVVPPSVVLTKTVGLDASVCATTDEITVGSDTAVTYCYAVTNTGVTGLALHDLEDSALGVIWSGRAFDLAPQATTFVTQTAILTETTTNAATWTAYNAGPADVVSSIDTATVTVVPPSIVLTKTVGLDPSACATADEITVGPDTEVTYCYRVANTGLTGLGLHHLEDSALGVLLDGFGHDLPPQATTIVTQTAVIAETTVNTATWTAYNPGRETPASAVDTATVTVAHSLYLPTTLRH